MRLFKTNLFEKTEILYREVSMPVNNNETGTIFGGHIMGCHDLAGSYLAAQIIKGSMVSVNTSDFDFVAPLHVGDLVTIYGIVIEVGRTSVTVYLEMWGKKLTDYGKAKDFLASRSTWKFVSINKEKGVALAINRSNNRELEQLLAQGAKILAEEQHG